MKIDELELHKNRAIEHFLMDSKVESSQYSHLIDFMDYVSDKLCNGEEVSKEFFEDEIFCIVPEKRGDYQFCELITRCWYEERQWPEVFEYFYGDLPKYSYIKNRV